MAEEGEGDPPPPDAPPPPPSRPVGDKQAKKDADMAKKAAKNAGAKKHPEAKALWEEAEQLYKNKDFDAAAQLYQDAEAEAQSAGQREGDGAHVGGRGPAGASAYELSGGAAPDHHLGGAKMRCSGHIFPVRDDWVMGQKLKKDKKVWGVVYEGAHADLTSWRPHLDVCKGKKDVASPTESHELAGGASVEMAHVRVTRWPHITPAVPCLVCLRPG
jgi:hypothetical protein